MRICFFGDSIVNGTGDDDCLGWTGRICASVRRSGHDVTHYNLGVRRDTSGNVAARWRQEAERRLPPNGDGHLVFSFGANDCLSGGAGDIRVTPDQTVVTARSLLSEASKWLPTLMIGPAPVSFDADTDRRIAVLSEDLEQVCETIGLPYLSVFPALATSRIWCQEAERGDGTHPNSGGYSELAAIISKWSGWKAWFC
jgi:acyl-CoA thioesterase I